MNPFDKYQNLQTTQTDNLGRWYGTVEQPLMYPGVTSILGETLRNKWEGKDPKNMEEAAVRGTAIHSLFEEELKQTPGLQPVSPEYTDTVNSFKQWVAVKKVKPIYHENKVVSTKYGFAGQIDLIAEVAGKVTVVDYKTGFEYDNKWGLQVAAYHLAVAEILNMNPKDLGFGILHIPFRNPKAFKWLPFTHYEWLQRGFLAALELYKHQPRFTELKKMNWPYLFKPAIEKKET